MSSDESFVWTSASDGNPNDSCDNMIQDSYKMEIEEQEEKDVNEEIEVLDKSKKTKKRKASKIEVNEVTKKNSIKDEPLSDTDLKKNKVKLKQEISKGSNDDDSSMFDDSYLNLRVKEEEASCVNNSNISTKKKKKKKHSYKESSDIDENITEINGKLGKFDNDSFSNLTTEDKVTVEETVITRAYNNFVEHIEDEKTNYVKHKKKKKKHKKSLSEDCDQTEIDNETNSSSFIIKNDTQISDCAETSIVENGYVSESGSSKNVGVSKKTQKTCKVSDRIRFEDDISDMDLNQTNKHTKTDKENARPKPKQVRQYLKKNTNLQPLSPKAKEDSIVTDNDDIWLLKCPRDIDIISFKGISLNTYNNKKKLKINDKVYDSIVENDLTKLPILTYYSQNKPIIKNLKLNGCIVLRNKVPKVHIPETGTMINDQTNFIPLPETKCRHPLFGVNYKKSIKIPVEIAKRLKDESLNMLDENVRKKKKKQKKDKRKSDREVNQEEIEEVKLEEEVPCKKKKKRKHSIDNTTPVKAKRVKHDPDCEQTWESEKAIEETLFNF